MNILEACRDPEIFAPWFRKPETFKSWFAFLAALFGLPMDDEELAIYRQHTGRDSPPTEPQEEAWLIIGRRGGKSFVSALIAVYLGCLFDYSEYLSPGERATVMVIAADKKQARVILRYIRAMLDGIAVFESMVVRDTADSFDLNNSVTIEVGTASFRSTRGYTYAAVLADEIAFWRTDDAAEPDYAILDAIRPGMSTIPSAMLLCMSSPYARRGALWEAFRRYYGKEGQSLVWRAKTRDMNPTVRQSVIDKAMERDPAAASAEYGAEFRSDIEAFVTREVVEACTDSGVVERKYFSGFQYRAFVDPSGGSNDSMTFAIAHRDEENEVLDLTREIKPPFSPEQVVKDFCAEMKRWGLSEVTGDRYAGEWPREQFRKNGIAYELAEQTRSDLYRDMLPLLNSGSARLLESDRLLNQIVGLERRVARGGKESIDHGPNSHDDLANAVAGALSLVKEKQSSQVAMFLTSKHRRAA